jgi:deaminated glutathione amidase
MTWTNHPDVEVRLGEIAVGVCQFSPGDDSRKNIDSIRRLAGTAAARGARLIVFPEYSSFFVHPLSEKFVAAAETLDGDFVVALARLAEDLEVFIVAGLVEKAEDPALFSNTLVAVAPDGRLVATYRKQHLYDAFGAHESDWVAAGSLDEPQTFDVDGVTVGMQTCYDIRFPEVTRRLVDAGADVVVVPAEWVRGPLKEHHWRTLLVARAIENTIYVAAADHIPPIGVGASMIVDPMGVVISEAGEQEDVSVGWISADRITAVRSVNPSLASRRYRVEPR